MPSLSAACRRLVVAALPFVLGACVLDLTGLTDGVPGGGGGSGSTGSGTTTGACSPLSCGACEAPCPEAGCAPVVLASGPGQAATPLGLAVAPGALYWANEASGTLMRLLDDGSPPEEIAQGVDSPRSVAAGTDLIIWSAGDGVWACPPGACAAQKKMLAASIASGSVREVAYDGKYVYWTDHGTDAAAEVGQVLRCAPEGCQPVVIAAAQWAPTGLFVLDNTLFWTLQADAFPSGHIYKTPKSSQGFDDLAAGITRPTGLTADGPFTYWTEYTSTGKILRCPHSEGYCSAPDNVAPAAGPLSYPRDIAVAGGRVYWSTTEGDGAVRSCPSPGCGPDEAPRVHASARQSLRRMVVGESCVFFTDESGGGAVVKVAR